MDKETIMKQSKTNNEDKKSSTQNKGDYIEMSQIKNYILKDMKRK